jgi:NTP pyrophosphatase (non-canonical NTP hydrolase)
MTFKEYSDEAHTYASFDKIETNGNDITFVYPTLGLAGEAGEAAEKVKKVVRNDKGVLTDEKRKEILKELGDVLWYVNETAIQLGYTLDDVANSNLFKLRDREARGVVCSEGDNR